jgi:hypothetical protein
MFVSFNVIDILLLLLAPLVFFSIHSIHFRHDIWMKCKVSERKISISMRRWSGNGKKYQNRKSIFMPGIWFNIYIYLDIHVPVSSFLHHLRWKGAGVEIRSIFHAKKIYLKSLKEAFHVWNMRNIFISRCQIFFGLYGRLTCLDVYIYV